jgi:mRNA-degrading endonuclease RelE of RelBE toxin-antitoxin system
VSFRIEFSPDAEQHLDSLRKHEQARIINAIEDQLRTEPTRMTRRRKPMRSNLIATWELRIGDFRAYYDVDEAAHSVLVRAIGVKRHNRVFVAGQEIDL